MVQIMSEVSTDIHMSMNGHKACVRGCSEPAIYFLMRPMRNGKMIKGFYCDKHEKQFGRQNLRRLAKDEKGHLGSMVDDLGQFDAILQS